MNKEKSHQEEDDEEEENIEKFYGLIKNYREARDRRMQELSEREMMMMTMNNKKKRKCNENENSAGGWMPSFEWEDFKQEKVEFIKKSLQMLPPQGTGTAIINNSINPNCATCSCVNDSQGKKEEIRLDLDLKLGI